VSEILLVSLAALSAIFGAAVSRFATHKAATIGFKCQQNERQLFTALQDLHYMKKVEKILFQRVAQSEAIGEKTLKREVRKIVDNRFGRPLSQSAGNKRLMHALESLHRDFCLNDVASVPRLT
jgi:hypothetical protein